MDDAHLNDSLIVIKLGILLQSISDNIQSKMSVFFSDTHWRLDPEHLVMVVMGACNNSPSNLTPLGIKLRYPNWEGKCIKVSHFSKFLSEGFSDVSVMSMYVRVASEYVIREKSVLSEGSGC